MTMTYDKIWTIIILEKASSFSTVVCGHRQSFQLGFLNFLTQSHNFLTGVGEDQILSLVDVVDVYDLSKDGRQGE